MTTNFVRLLDALKRNLASLVRSWPFRRLGQDEIRDRFLHSVQVASAADDPADKIDAARQALKDEACLDEWPLDIPRHQLRATMRVVLANAYDDLGADGPPEHLDRSIAAYEQALTDIDTALLPTLWAETQNNLGFAYWRRQAGDRSENIAQAISAYQNALTVYDRETSPEEWATLQNNLANAYIDWPQGDRRENLERAIAAYEAALAIHTRDTYPVDWSMLQNNLGSAYHERIAGDRADNIEQAIAAYEAALKERLPTTSPREWAVTQDNLGNAYQDRVKGARADNIDRAIAHHEAALTHLAADDTPFEWATAQNNLGVSYEARINGDWEENLERAIVAYEAALSVTTRETSPAAWAETQNNLGIALVKRVRGDRGENIERAIAAFDAALTVHTKGAHPRDWALALSNLGLAYQDRHFGERAANLEHARTAYLSALTVYTREDFPREWARTQNNLALVYIHRVAGDRGQNLECAAEVLEAVLQARAIDTDPHRRAATQTVLGLAHLTMAEELKRHSLTAAVACFDAALTVRTRDAHPRDHLLTARLLARAHTWSGNLPAARSAYEPAREAFVQLFAEGLNEVEARDLLMEAGSLYMEGAFASAKAGDLQGALAWANEGKARLLGVALRLRALETRADASRIQMLRREIRACSRALDAGDTVDRAETIARLVAFRRELRSVVAEAEGPTRVDVRSRKVLASFFPHGGALVVPIVTRFGSTFLVVVQPSHGAPDDGSAAIAVLNLPELTSPRLDTFLKGPSGEPKLGGWLAAYTQNYELARLGTEIAALPALSSRRDALEQTYLRLDNEWRSAVGDLGPTLWQLFAGALWDTLQGLGVLTNQRLLWMPPGATGLLPLALAQNPVTKRFFADEYEIAYVPSLDTLAHAIPHVHDPRPPTLAAIINPTGDLDYAPIEADLVSHHFPAAVRLDHDTATSENVLDALRHTTYWHFATHGRFAWRDPRLSNLRLTDGKTLAVGDLAEATGLCPPRLVVLSACETGLYDTRRTPDEFIGWPATFMSLGATGVLSTLWLVDDRATTLLTAKFYDLHMAGGLAPAAALRQAQMWLKAASTTDLLAFIRSKVEEGALAADQLSHLEHMLQTSPMCARIRGIFGWLPVFAHPTPPDPASPSSPPFEHPFFWAGFVHTGL
jgi:CHAT domain-containing protein/tetratricopeptide (TPR) repeat protein